MLRSEKSAGEEEEEDEPELWMAAAQGDVPTVQRLVESGADFTWEDTFGSTALHCACTNGHVVCARLLITARASVDRRAGALATALDACEVLAVSTGASAGGRRHTREATLAHEVRVLEAEVVGLGGSAAIGGGNRPVTIAAAARLEAVGGATVVAVVAGAGRPAAGAALEAHVDLRSAPGGAPTRLVLALDFCAPAAYKLCAAHVAHGAINVADVTTCVEIQ